MYRKWKVTKQIARVKNCSSSIFLLSFFLGNIFQLFIIVRFSLKDLEKEYAKTEDVINAVQSVVQIVGEVMKQLDTDRCMYSEFILHRRTYIHIVFFNSHCKGIFRTSICWFLSSNSSCGQAQLFPWPSSRLKTDTRVSLDMTTLTIIRILPIPSFTRWVWKNQDSEVHSLLSSAV